jgi:pilus assembly protein Flp/PilA
VVARSGLRAFLACQSGATAVEYGLIVTLIFLVIVGSVSTFASKATTMFTNISTTIGAAM